MGTADRDYFQHGEQKPPGFLAALPPVVRWLLILNVGIYLLEQLSLQFRNQSLLGLGAFEMQSALFEGQVWRLITFQFLHFGFLHILMNSIGLYALGPFLERAWGSSRFLVYYLLCGVGGGLFYSLLAGLHLLPSSPLVGASAGVYGILAGIAVLAPQLRVTLYFSPVTLTLRQLAWWVMGISAFLLITRMGGNSGGDAGHLGGIFAGFLLAKNPVLLNWADRKNSLMEIIPSRAFKRRQEAKLRPRSEVNLRSDTEVDRILDKISREGFQSLSKTEQETLHKASKAHQTKP